MKQIIIEAVTHKLSEVKMFTTHFMGVKIVYTNKDSYWEAEVFQYGFKRGYMLTDKYVPSIGEVRTNFNKCSSYRLHKGDDIYIIED